MRAAKLIRSTFTDRRFLKETAFFAVPVILTLFLSTITNFVDTLMVGKLGETAITAVGLGNKWYYLFFMVALGVQSGTGILMAQFFGADEPENLKKTFGLGLFIDLLTVLVFAGLALGAPALVMGLFTDSEASTPVGISYLKIVGWSYPLYAFSSLLCTLLRSIKKVRFPVYASIVSILCNLILNYILIFGKFGFPAMGVQGAAIATVLSRLAEFLMLLIFTLKATPYFKNGVKGMFIWNRELTKKFSSCSLPIVLNELLWGLGTTLYYVGYGRIGDDAVAALTITETVSKITNTASHGLSSAAAILLGIELGAGRLSRARENSAKLLTVGLTVSFASIVFLLLAEGPILSLFSVSESVLGDAKKCMIVYICSLPFYYIYDIIIEGILRSGGDSKANLFIDSSGVWFIALPLVLAGTFLWHLPIYWVYALTMTEVVYKTVLCLIRYKKMIWCRNLTADPEEAIRVENGEDPETGGREK